MKKKIFGLSLILFVFALFMSAKPVNAVSTTFYTNAAAYGFNVSRDYEPYYMSDFNVDKNEYFERDTLQHQTNIVQVLLRNKIDTSLWCFIYRVQLSPRQVRDNGVLGIGSNGDNWYNRKIKTTIKFRDTSYQIINYAPQNEPLATSGLIGVGLDSSGPSVSASVDFNHSDLRITSNTKSSENKYETIYNYNSHVFNTNSYLGGDVYAYGMVLFRHIGTTWVDISYEIGYYGHIWYGYSENSSACMVRKSYSF